MSRRFFVEKIADEVTLCGDEFRHARGVLRLTAGSEVTLLDGSGREYRAVISAVERDGMRLNVLGEAEETNEPEADIYLLCGALKGDKTELVVQKAVELGANKIGVFSSRYCSAYMNENKLERFRRVSREAAKQCGRSRAPEVVYFGDFDSALASCADYPQKLFACEFLKSGEGARTEEVAKEGACALVVGSEGGFTKEEYARATEQGFSGVSLGKRILRAETAAIALLSIVMFFKGELQ